MIAFDLANRYLNAWISKYDKENQLVLLEDLLTLIKKINASETVLSLLENPKISSSEKQTILERLFKKDLTKKEISQFLNVLLEKKRESLMKVLEKAIKELTRELSVKKEALIYVSETLDETSKKTIIKIIEEKIKSPIEATFNEDKDLLGGFKAVVHHKLINCSCRSILETYRQNVLAKT